MKAAVFHAPGDMRIETVPTPIIGDDDVLLKVHACAICGTDPKILAHGWPNQPPYGKYIFGHEYAAEVVPLILGTLPFSRIHDELVEQLAALAAALQKRV